MVAPADAALDPITILLADSTREDPVAATGRLAGGRGVDVAKVAITP